MITKDFVRARLSTALAITFATAIATRPGPAVADLIVTPPPAPVTIDEGFQGLQVTFSVTNDGPNDVNQPALSIGIIQFGVDFSDAIFNPFLVSGPATIAAGGTEDFILGFSTNPQEIPSDHNVGGNHINFGITMIDVVTNQPVHGSGAYTVFVRDTPEPSSLLMSGIGALALISLAALRRGGRGVAGPSIGDLTACSGRAHRR